MAQLLANGWIVTMDDHGTEHREGWVLVEDGLVRGSLRSKDPRADVCKVASQFGGGGHTLAAGLRARGTLAEVQEKVLKAIHDQLP